MALQWGGVIVYYACKFQSQNDIFSPRGRGNETWTYMFIISFPNLTVWSFDCIEMSDICSARSVRGQLKIRVAIWLWLHAFFALYQKGGPPTVSLVWTTFEGKITPPELYKTQMPLRDVHFNAAFPLYTEVGISEFWVGRFNWNAPRKVEFLLIKSENPHYPQAAIPRWLPRL